jgi:hypothetical protein
VRPQDAAIVDEQTGGETLGDSRARETYLGRLLAIDRMNAPTGIAIRK